MKFILFIVGVICLNSCVAPNQTFHSIPPGIWRGVLLLDRTPVMKYGDDRDIVKKFDTESELPFNFEVICDTDSTFHIVIHNDTERIKVTDISFGRDKSTAKDTVIIKFPIYDTYIRAIYEDGVMEGDWIVNYKDNYRIPFKAVHGVADRFENLGTKEDKLTGKWESTFEIGTPDERMRLQSSRKLYRLDPIPLRGKIAKAAHAFHHQEQSSASLYGVESGHNRQQEVEYQGKLQYAPDNQWPNSENQWSSVSAVLKFFNISASSILTCCCAL